MSMDQKVEAFYRSIFSDLTLDRNEASEVTTFFEECNPPPDKLVWLRATSFRIGCEFLGEDQDNNVALLRCINAIVHTLETTCME
jgi:poly(U)-specific endoribonuclease